MNNLFSKCTTGVGIFSDTLLQSCVNHFKTLIKYFEIDSIAPIEDFSLKVEKYNNEVKERFDAYNERYKYSVFDRHGKNIIKGNKVIKKAYQLCTETERLKYGIQKVNIAPLLSVVYYLEKGGSIQNFFKENKITSSSAYRYRKQLEKFKIFENTLFHEEIIQEKFDYFDYYDLTSNFLYRKKFYLKQKHYLFD